MNKHALLNLIGTGIYGSVIPDDDATMKVLSECIAQGLVRSDPARIDDFFWLTKDGQKIARLSPATGAGEQ